MRAGCAGISLTIEQVAVTPDLCYRCYLSFCYGRKALATGRGGAIIVTDVLRAECD
jgi:hypothetical protein